MQGEYVSTLTQLFDIYLGKYKEVLDYINELDEKEVRPMDITLRDRETWWQASVYLLETLFIMQSDGKDVEEEVAYLTIKLSELDPDRLDKWLDQMSKKKLSGQSKG